MLRRTCILLAAAVLIMSGCGDTTPSAPTLPPMSWQQVRVSGQAFEVEGYVRMASVVAGGPGLVGVGYDGWFAAVWTSSDGLTWSQVLQDEDVFGGARMASVVVGGPGLVAVGVEVAGDESATDAAVWTSPDGLTWNRVPHNEDVFGGDGSQSMLSVVVGGPGLVAVGTNSPHGDVWNDAAVWTSPDGLTWNRVPHNEDVFGGNQTQVMNSVVAGGPGLVAVGYDSSSGWDGAVWTSPDGLTWTRVPHNEDVFGGATLRSVVAGGPGLVAVGSGRALVWTSPDGLTWNQIPNDEEAFGEDRSQEMHSVVIGAPGLVAVGSARTGDDDAIDAAVWTSPDGLTWNRVPHNESVFGGDPELMMRSVIVGGPGLVVIGIERDSLVGDFGVVAVWTAASR